MYGHDHVYQQKLNPRRGNFKIANEIEPLKIFNFILGTTWTFVSGNKCIQVYKKLTSTKKYV